MIGIEPMSERDNDDFLPLELFYSTGGMFTPNNRLNNFFNYDNAHNYAPRYCRVPAERLLGSRCPTSKLTPQYCGGFL